ncbi:MAG: class I SAM-dependent RNA methyltransferase, partial [Lachnospiraceae bacterium]|nr:class I SAM-dependent RNA methyltransferase [Lachnospiraceae bacterium]
MEKYRLMAPCHFGMEAVLKKEIQELGYEITEVMDGRVIFAGGGEAVARSNVFLRTAERVLLIAGDFTATTYDELFEGIRSIDWSSYIPENGKFWVTKAASVKSKLYSPSDIQSIVKKAMVERMKEKYKTD